MSDLIIDHKAINFCLEQGLKTVQTELKRISKMGGVHYQVAHDFEIQLKELEDRIKSIDPNHFWEHHRELLEDRINNLKYRSIIDGDQLPKVMEWLIGKPKKKRKKKAL